MKEGIKVKANVHVCFKNTKTGVCKYIDIHNTVVDVGFNAIAKLVIANYSDLADGTLYDVGAGDSATAVSSTDTDLLGTNTAWAIYRDRYAINDKAYLTGTFLNAEANFEWKEVGIRTKDDTLVARAILDSPYFTKTSDYTATIDWEIDFS